MTSRFATNFVPSKLKQQHYLEVDKDGVPLQGQVAQSYQLYADAGGSLLYDGSNVLIFDTAVSGSTLTVNFTHGYNNLGRSCDLVFKRTLAHDVVLDFGTGTVVVPGNASTALHTFTIPSGTLPTTGRIDFFSRTEASLVVSPYVAPVPQLTVNTLNFRTSTDINNELNFVTPFPIEWVTAGAGTFNNTDLVLNGGDLLNTCRAFFTTTAGDYDIAISMYLANCPVNVGLLAYIDVDSVLYSFQNSSLNLNGQSFNMSASLHLDAGQLVQIFAGNAAGPTADGGTSVTPAQAYHGCISITQFITL